MNILALNGSPRRDGNTDMLLAALLRGAAGQGAAIECVLLSELNLSPCTHCDGCLATGNCVIPDAMETVYAALERADGIVIASPLHFMSITAQLKLAIDRCQAIWARKYILKKAPLGDNRPRCGLYLGVGGRQSEGLFAAATAVVKSLFFVLNVRYLGSLTFAGVDEKGAIRLVPLALEKAFTAGENLVKGVPPEGIPRV